MLPLVIGDSLIKHLPASKKFDVCAKGGLSAEDFLFAVCQGAYDCYLQDRTLILLALGTNDVCNFFPKHVVALLLSCAQAIVARNRQVVVVICAILPRPQCNDLYQIPIKVVNRSLEVLAPLYGFPFLKTHKAFLEFGVPRMSQFDSGGLHLSSRGQKALYNTLCSAVTQTYTSAVQFENFRGPSCVLSNFYPQLVHAFNRDFICTEQAYQWRKVFEHGKSLLRIAIVSTTDPFEIKRLGNITTCDRWHARKVELMRELLLCRCRPNTGNKYRDHLLLFPTTVFVESTNDNFWGAGPTSKGSNTLGSLHILVRCLLWLGLV
jgi:ribA/ribD-fused uncharacterized protein